MTIVSLVTNSWALLSGWEIILLVMEWEAYVEGGYHTFCSEDIKVCFYSFLDRQVAWQHEQSICLAQLIFLLMKQYVAFMPYHKEMKRGNLSSNLDRSEIQR